MSVVSNDLTLNFAFELFKGMQLDNLNYIYRGTFTQSITDNILSLTEVNLSKAGESSKIKKRVYSILVECLQNITRHQEEATDVPDPTGIFIIQKKESKYFITTGNVVENIKIDVIKKLIDKINSLDTDQLKDYYKEVLNTGELSDKGGAGLGLIEMARKSGNKLSYEFSEVDNNFSFFYLHAGISFENDELQEIHEEIKQSLANIVQLNTILREENILLTFNGGFNQESMVLLLSITEGQMTGNVNIKKKMFYIMVEMLQNIVKHANSKGEMTESGNPGMFFISEKETHFEFTSGNYIETSQVEQLSKKIDYVNSLSKSDLDQYYSKNLINFEIDDSKKAGLGLIDMRIKSGKTLKYYFNEIDASLSFFTLQIDITKE